MDSLYSDRDPLALATDWMRAGKRVVMATVIRTWGSSPRPVGSHLVIDQDGRFEGSVSGGCVEGAVVTEALEVMEDGRPRVLEFGVADDDAWTVGLACGGTIHVAVHPVERDLVDRLLALRQSRSRAALVLRLPDGAQGVRGDATAGTLDLNSEEDAAVAALVAEERSGLVGLPRQGLFVRAYPPPPRLVVIGAVHVAQALAPLAALAGFAVTVVDPRTAFANADRFPGVEIIGEWPEDALPGLALDRHTAVVTLTHDPKLDDPALVAALRSQAFFIGAIGSRRTHAARRARLHDHHGLRPEETARIEGPVGLAIGARTPQEIAVSIVGGLVKALRRPTGPRVAAVVLAAGRSSRMGGLNKLLQEVAGKPMVAHAVDAALACRADPVIVVTGHEADRVTAALGDRPVRLVHNAAYGEGIAASIRRGIAEVPDVCDGALIFLGDMPGITAAHVDRLLDAFRPTQGQAIVLPAIDGRRGNPVLWARRYFRDLLDLTGDTGGRQLLERFACELCLVSMEDMNGGTAVLQDVDTPEALAALRRR